MAIINALSPSFIHVSGAINSGNHGDTVVIPTGEAVWTNSLTVTKCLTISGAGTGSSVFTRIKRSGDIFDLSPSANLPVRFTNIYFSHFEFSATSRVSIRISQNLTGLRVDHCRFDYGKRNIYPNKTTYGVVDHCYFFNTNLGIAPEFSSGTEAVEGDNQWALWTANPFNFLGTTKNLVIEDNIFFNDSETTEDPNEKLYGATASMAVFRYNTVIHTNGAENWLNAIDAHGWPNEDTWGRGTIMYEIYGNTFSFQKSYRLMNFRGGSHLVYNNTITGVGSQPTIDLRDESLINTPTPSEKDTISGTYFWNNTYNGNPITLNVVHPSTIVEDVDYFMRAPSGSDVFAAYTPLVYPHPFTVEGGYNPPILVTQSGSVLRIKFIGCRY
jgi:hypothetical protein